jgi:hypothetical protein
VVKSVDDRFLSFAPAPRPKVGVLPAGGTPQSAVPVPKSSLEAAQLALNNPGMYGA